MNFEKLKNLVLDLYDSNDSSLKEFPSFLEEIISLLNSGEIRVCEKENDWFINDWIKKAIVLYLKYKKSECFEGVYDKVPLKFKDWTEKDFEKAEIRVLPGTIVRTGAFLDKGVVLINCFVNIGARIGQKTMIDSFATVGSCAQIGAKCHISSGCVIGGVLEPINAMPVIIEDDCFIGANSVIAEGVIIRKGSTVAMGTRIGASTKIIERDSGKELKKEIPENALVVPGTYNTSNGLSISCAIIIGYKDTKLEINENLRR